jgi:hypothetical protein
VETDLDVPLGSLQNMDGSFQILIRDGRVLFQGGSLVLREAVEVHLERVERGISYHVSRTGRAREQQPQGSKDGEADGQTQKALRPGSSDSVVGDGSGNTEVRDNKFWDRGRYLYRCSFYSLE